MLHTLAFDLGNVLVDWKAAPHIQKELGFRREEAERLAELVFGGPVWVRGDLGTADRAQIEAQLIRDNPDDADAIHRILANCDPWLKEFPETTAMLERLKAAGFGIYYISNTNPAAVAYMEKNCRFWRLFDGGIASFRHGILKPSAEIYNLFLETCGKKAEECLFVDDLPANVEGAAACGFQARQLTEPGRMREILCSFPELRHFL